jgi:hypothetical protein
VTSVTRSGVTDVTRGPVTTDTDPGKRWGAHSGPIPKPTRGRVTKGVNRMAEKKISPKKRGSGSSSSSKTAATRVTKRRAARKGLRKSARKSARKR